MLITFFAKKILFFKTKIGLLKWEKRLFVENFISLHEEKYKAKIGKKEYKLLENNIVYPSFCVIDVYVNNKFKKRYEKCYALYNYLEKCKMKTYIPEYILNDPTVWQKDKIDFINNQQKVNSNRN